MTRPSSLPRLAAWSAVASAPLALGCLFSALAAVGYDVDALADPAAGVGHGARGADWLYASMILDALGYYLLLAPAVLHLDRALRRRDDGLATLITASGLGYILVGALGASVLAAVCPPLMRELELAAEPETHAITLVLRAALLAVHGGLWNFLEMILAAVFWLGAGAMLRAERPRFAALTMALGAAAAVDAVGETIGSAELASLGLSIYLVLAPAWALCLGVLVARELGTRAPAPMPAVIG